MILGEAENVVEGIPGKFSLNLNPGKYIVNCPTGSEEDQGTLEATGQATGKPQGASAALLTKATNGYKSYVEGEVAKLLAGTKEFVAALEAGDTTKAKELFGPTRIHYEAIEPVAESFGELDPEIDARVNDVAHESEWEGFHPIERTLWERNTTKGTQAYAKRLSANVETLQRKVKTIKLQAAQLANGAVELMNEVSTSKITGEEDRYSHTDLSDFEGNLSGSRKAFVLLIPALKQTGNAKLATEIEERFGEVQKSLDAYKRGTPLGFALYGELSAKDKRHFAEEVDALAEPLSTVAAKVSGAWEEVRRPGQLLTTSATPMALVVVLGWLCSWAAPASASAGGPTVAELDGVAALLRSGRSAPGGAVPASAVTTARRLDATLSTSRGRLHPWALPQRVEALTARLATELSQAGFAGHPSASPYTAIEALLDRADAAARDGAHGAAVAHGAEAYALFAAGPGARLEAANPALAAAVDKAFWQREGTEPGLLAALEAGGRRTALDASLSRARAQVETAAFALGDRSVGQGTVVADAAVIVFREGLEAVLIVAAVTAAFVGERRRLRRPVLAGALLGLLASAVTYVLAQAIVSALGDGGLRLQAITGLLAIVVLLVVTNWFFHRLYWSEWIGRFHRRRRALERFDRRGFLSGQIAALVLLGLTSVYREGFETVLFLQNLQVSAGTHATLLGVAIGLGATFVVGFITFRLERKLPYKKMLIATGVLIGLVLAVMVGTTVHTMQGLGWVPSTPTEFQLPLWCGRWLGAFPTWEGIGAQVSALLVVYGSYALARHLQAASRRRAMGELRGDRESALG